MRSLAILAVLIAGGLLATVGVSLQQWGDRPVDMVAITNEDAAKLFGAGCAPALQVVGPGCASPGCNPTGSIYNQIAGRSNYTPVPNNTGCTSKTGGNCGTWDDLNRCATN